MTLEEAILHCLEQSKDCNECASEHYQLAVWLRELQEYRKLAKDNKLIDSYMYSEEKEVRCQTCLFEEDNMKLEPCKSCIEKGENIRV